ncbi:MAG TPA: hypothetical protein VEX86_16280 [Longimicrobium sp.]|nr:hypothetical protein [Longimicrobium sp.]
MRRSRTLLLVLLAGMLPLAQGCRAFGRAPRETVLIEVDNNVTLPTAWTVYAFSEAGARRLVGSLSPGRPGTLRLSAGNVEGRYRFTAVRQLGSPITSPSIALQGGETVTWSLRDNVILEAR